MKRLLSLLALICLLYTSATHAQVGDLPRSTPEAERISSRAIQRFFESIQALPATEIHHLMVVRNGRVVAECHPAPYRATDSHTLFSASKTLTALAVGIAISQNRLSTSDRIVTFFPAKLPEKVTPELASITVKDLLIMASGIKPDWEMRSFGDDWIREWLAKPVTSKPGTRFQYDSMCTFMLSAIVQKATGKTVLQLLNQHLFGPMHIYEAEWELSPDGICTGGWGLRMQAESLAKIGILMLQRGQWEGRQLISEAWIDECTKPYINYDGAALQKPTEKNQGYGYQLWRCLKPGAYRLDGAYGQFVVIDPATETVVVILGSSDKTADELACIPAYLYPGIDSPIPENKNQLKTLEQVAAKAALPMPKGKPTSNAFTHADFKLAKNDHNIDLIKFYTENGQNQLRIYYTDTRDETIPVAYNKWAYGALTTTTPPYVITARNRFSGLKHNFATAATYAWTTPTKLHIQLQYVNWISATDIVIDTQAQTATFTNNFNRNKPQTVTCAIVSQ